MKLKPLLPSLKEKKRYLSFEVISDKQFSAESVSKAITESTLKFLGTLETGKAGLMILNDKFSNNTGVLKTNHKFVDKLRTSLTLIKDIDTKDVIMRTRIVSGTLKKSISKFNELKKIEV